MILSKYSVTIVSFSLRITRIILSGYIGYPLHR